MENGFKIKGQNLSPERREKFAEKYKEVEKEAMTPYGNELEKSEKAKEVINFINACLNKKFNEMGLRYGNIPLEKIHIFSKENFEKTFPSKKDLNGFSLSTLKEANIKASDIEIAGIFKAILHEMVHLASYNVYFANTSSDELKENYRSGYFNVQHQSENCHCHFSALDEGVVDLVVSEIVQENLDTIFKMLDLQKDDWKNVSWYHDELNLINIIAEKISTQKGESVDDVCKKFKRGLFSGEMMHLRDVEKVYGKSSLRILSYFEPNIEKNDNESISFKEKIYEFFETDDDNRRGELRNEIIESRRF